MKEIRRAVPGDVKDIMKLLGQVLEIHHEGRPDLFKTNASKYTNEELIGLIEKVSDPIFVACDDDGHVIGYAFCKEKQVLSSNYMTDIRTLHIDDLCVDEDQRGNHIGEALYRHVLEYAKENGFYNLTLNVWSCNTNAVEFYRKMGMKSQRMEMETIIK